MYCNITFSILDFIIMKSFSNMYMHKIWLSFLHYNIIQVSNGLTWRGRKLTNMP